MSEETKEVQEFDVNAIMEETLAEETAASADSPSDPTIDTPETSDIPADEDLSTEGEDTPSEEKTTPSAPPYDFYNPATWGDKTAEEVVKEIQQYNNSISETNAGLKERVNQLETGASQTQAEITRFLANPDLYNQLREKAGFASPTPKPEEDIDLSSIQDVPTLLKEVKNLIAREREENRNHTQTLLQQAQATFAQQADQALMPQKVAKWETAIKDLSKDTTIGTDFAEVNEGIRQALLTSPKCEHLRNAYSAQKLNEKEVLLETFKLLHEDRYVESIIKQRQSQAKANIEASTEPKGKRTKKSAKPDEVDTGNLALDILAEYAADNS